MIKVLHLFTSAIHNIVFVKVYPVKKMRLLIEETGILNIYKEYGLSGLENSDFNKTLSAREFEE